MSTRLRRSFIWHAMAIAALVSQPLSAEEKWWEKDPVVPVLEAVCFETQIRDIEKKCRAGDVIDSINYNLVSVVCDYRYTIIHKNDEASCVYLGNRRVDRLFLRSD